MKRLTVLKLLLATVCIVSLFACAACKEKPVEEPPKTVYYTVTFDSFGGSEVPSQRVESGKTATLPTPPTKDGYTFKAWMYKGTEWSFGNPITSDLKLSATWYDKSIKYRVTVGVETSLADRGNAVIEGAQASSTLFSEGEEVTLRATANEGFEFKGWIDYDTGKTVSDNSVYTFIATGDVTVEASFKYVVSGLDNRENEIFWNALNKTAEENSFRFQLVKQTGDVTTVYSFSVNRAQGFAVLGEYGDNCDDVARELWIEYTDGVCKYYSFEDGVLEELALPEAEGLDMNSYVGALFDGEMDVADKEQLLLAIYTVFKGNLTSSDDGLNFALPLADVLNGARDIYLENKDTPAQKLLYDYLKPAIDEMLKQNDQVIYDDFKVSDIVKETSLESLIKMIGMAQSDNPTVADGQAFLDEFNENAEKAITALCDYLTDAGLSYDAEALTEEYRSIMKGSFNSALGRLNNSTVGGSLGDIPEGTDIVATVIYATLKNFTAGDIAYAVLDELGIIGSSLDITDETLDFSDEELVGSITLEDGVITYMYATVEDTGADGTLAFEFFTDIGELQLPQTAENA